MNNFQGKWLERWKNTRQRGLNRYLFNQTLLIGGALVLGRVIGVALFTNQSQWEQFFTSLPTTIFLVLVVCIPLTIISWFISEWLYRKFTK